MKNYYFGSALGKVEKLLIKAEDENLPEQIHLAAVLRSFKCVPNYLGGHQVEYTGYHRQKRGLGEDDQWRT